MADETTLENQQAAVPGTEAAAGAQAAAAAVDQNAGAAAAEGQEPADTSGAPEAAATEIKALSVEEILAQHGISQDELKEFQDAKKAKADEENKPKVETQRWLEVISHGVKTGQLTKEDALKAEELSKTSDKDVVFAEFKAKFPNPDKLEGAELDEYLQDEFADAYNLHATSESAKNKTELLLKTEAQQIRNESLSKINNVEKAYTKTQLAASLTNQHKALFAEIAAKPITQTFKVKDEDVTIEVPNTITEEEVKAALKSDEAKSLLNFMGMVHAEDPKAADEIYKSFVQSLSVAKTEAAKTQEVWNRAVDWAKKEYSVGSSKPFDSKEGKNDGKGGKVMTKAEAQRELQSGQQV